MHSATSSDASSKSPRRVVGLVSLAEARSLVRPGKRVSRATLISMHLRGEVQILAVGRRYVVTIATINDYRRAHGHGPVGARGSGALDEMGSL